MRRQRLIASIAMSIVLLGGLMSPSARAVITQVNEENASQTFFVASATDLINQGSPALLSSSDGPTDVLINGQTGATNVLSDGKFVAGDWTNTYTLNTSSPATASGYNISMVQSISAWSPQRQDQNYDLYYSVVGDASFQHLGTFTNELLSTDNNQSTRITLTDTSTSGNFIATGVDAIQFTVHTGSDGQVDVYREFDVFGNVPEPTAAVLLPASLMLTLRRKSRAA